MRPALRTLARAKVNLALHVTGRRSDGYHELDSLVVFPEIGDRLSIEADDHVSLHVHGRFADALTETPARDNLVVRAAECLLARLGADGLGARMTLQKSVPVAAGIGGGSSDAAAALRLLRELWAPALPDADLAALALPLGADVPMCLLEQPARIGGIGEDITPIAMMPRFGMVLVNPGTALATPAVFRALERRSNPPLPTLPAAGFPTLPDLLDWVEPTRNDLEPPAITLLPEIADVLEALRAAPETRLTRMSGSGATCFAITDDDAAAAKLAVKISAARPDWWVASGLCR